MTKPPIQLAYQARMFVPGDAYRHGQRRKMYNPIRTTPALVQAMTHLGVRGLPLADARRRAKAAVQEPEAGRYLESLGWEELLSFLDTIAVFLKAGPQGRKEKGMRAFNPQAEKALTIAERVTKAMALAGLIPGQGNAGNKLKQMGAHVTAARDRWEALAALARFYPRKGIPHFYVDALVELLETADLNAFKQVVAQSLIFHEAKDKTHDEHK